MSTTANEFEIDEETTHFVKSTLHAWMEAGVIKSNSYGVSIGIREGTSDEATYEEITRIGVEVESAEHNGQWYADNAAGKAKLAAMANCDSIEAIALWPIVAYGEAGIFPWGGAVIHRMFPLIVSTSGGIEDEDVLISRTVLEYMFMKGNRDGRAALEAARVAAGQGDGSDRFTKADPVES